MNEPTPAPAPATAPIPAPPPAATTPEPSPIDRAIAAKDVTAFREAKEAAKKAGQSTLPTPIPTPAVSPVAAAEVDDDDPPPVAAVPGAPPRQVSKRQQEKNDLIRARVEAEQKAARLEERLAARERPAPPKQAAPVADPEPDPTDLTKYPDGQYDRKFIKDQARWEAEQLYADREAKAQTARHETQRQQATLARESAFDARIQTVLTADPKFMDTVSDDVKGLLTFRQFAEAKQAGHLPADAEPTGYNTIAEAIVDSPTPDKLFRHFSDHPTELHRIAQLRPWDLARALGKLEHSLEAPTAPAPPTPQPKTISSMPAPGHVVGSHTQDPEDPQQAALKRRDFLGYQAAKRAKERAAAAAR